MSNIQLPGLGASLDQLLVAGFSSGSYESAQLAIAYPELFKCAGLMGGGIPFAGYAQGKYQDKMKELVGAWGQKEGKQIDEINAISQEILDNFNKAKDTKGYWGDQSLLKGMPVWVWGGQKDPTVPWFLTTSQAKYFEDAGADVTLTQAEHYAHMFNEFDVAGRVSQHCYKNEDPDYYNKYDIADRAWEKYGYYQKWDQELFVDQIQDVFTANGENKDKKITADFLGLKKWGSVFYPDQCVNGGCKMQLVIHGCGMNHEEFVEYWAPMALKHNLVTVFPQAKMCWDNFHDKQTGENHMSREGPQMLFMKAIVDRLSQPSDAAKYEYDYTKRPYTFGEAYPKEEFMFEIAPGFKIGSVCESTKRDDGQMSGGCFLEVPDGKGGIMKMTEEELREYFTNMEQGAEEGGDDNENVFEWGENGLTVHDDGNGRVTIEMWSQGALKLATGAAAAASLAMALI